MLVVAIVAATLAAVLISASYYALVPIPSADGEGHAKPAPSATTQAATELLRSAAIACLVGGLLDTAEWTTPANGALLGLALWTIPVVLLVGSVVHEGTPARTAATHAGDWLIKLLAVGMLIGLLA